MDGRVCYVLYDSEPTGSDKLDCSDTMMSLCIISTQVTVQLCSARTVWLRSCSNVITNQQRLHTCQYLYFTDGRVLTLVTVDDTYMHPKRVCKTECWQLCATVLVVMFREWRILAFKVFDVHSFLSFHLDLRPLLSYCSSVAYLCLLKALSEAGRPAIDSSQRYTLSTWLSHLVRAYHLWDEPVP